jgi:LDH2 family malate/lactate/ureidoglycolate dehydrogenase
MKTQRYEAQDLIRFGKSVLVNIGFPERQAKAAAMVLVEADLRGDHAHGIAGGSAMDDILAKVKDDVERLGFRRVEIPKNDENYELKRPYATAITVDAKGTLGHYVALDIIPEVIKVAKKYGVGKAYIRNSTHFGDCGIYTEMIADHDLAARVSCTSNQWTKPFIELQDREFLDSPSNVSRYRDVKKRFGTNPMAWSIPYEGGIITIDMAATQRAVSPAFEVAKYNSRALAITQDKEGMRYIGKGHKRQVLSDALHLALARAQSREQLGKELAMLGYGPEIDLKAVEAELLKGPEGEEIRYPLALDDTFKNHFWIAPLGGTLYGYKGYGLNMLIELDNVIGGGVTGLVRELDGNGSPKTPERVAQTIEAYAIDVVHPLEVAKTRLRESVQTTRECGNELLYLPGQKEQETKRHYLADGIPMTPERIDTLKTIAAEVGVPFDIAPR